MSSPSHRLRFRGSGWRLLRGHLAPLVLAAAPLSAAVCLSSARGSPLGPPHATLVSSLVAHTGGLEEVFLRAMSRFYGPEWHRWMPESVVAEHRRRFPTHFGSGVEAAFAAWMQVHFGAGWQQWVPAHVVYQCWSDFTNLRSR